MKYKISQHQFTKLRKNYILIGGGLSPINGNVITESRLKEFLVSVIINGFFAQIRVGAHNGVSSLSVVKKLFPQARPTGAYIAA
jgi:hypothetical protein